MKCVFLLFTVFTLNSFADNNLTAIQSKQIAKKINAVTAVSWTKGSFEMQFMHTSCTSEKFQCAFTFKMWPTHSEIETFEGSYNGRGKGFYWSANVLERGLVSAKCTLKELESFEDIVTTHGDIRADVTARLADCVGKITKTASR